MPPTCQALASRVQAGPPPPPPSNSARLIKVLKRPVGFQLSFTNLDGARASVSSGDRLSNSFERQEVVEDGEKEEMKEEKEEKKEEEEKSENAQVTGDGHWAGPGHPLGKSEISSRCDNCHQIVKDDTYRLYPNNCMECWRITLQRNTQWMYSEQIRNNIPREYLLPSFRLGFQLYWFWRNLSISWSTGLAMIMHSKHPEPKLIVSNSMNESTYQLDF